MAADFYTPMIQNLFCEKYYCRPLASVKFIRIFAISNTVRLVQLVEHQIVVLGVVGSSPTSHPNERTEVNSFRPLFLVQLNPFFDDGGDCLKSIITISED